MEKVNKPDNNGNVTLDFDGLLAAECRVENGNIVVLRAVVQLGEFCKH